MAFVLGPNALSRGYRLSGFDTIGSTSAEAIERARHGDPGSLWIAAKEQTAGHGRRGRPWQTADGNLAASLLLLMPGPPAQAAKLGFAAGLAVEAAIRAAAPGASLQTLLDAVDSADTRLTLKWPNDVLLGGAKVAGILLEAITLGDDGTAVVIGIGVNVRHVPTGLPYPTTSLAACGGDMSAEALFAALAEAWVAQEALWSGEAGFEPVRRRWLERAAGLGGPIAVRLGEDVYRGIFETIDDEGRLVVRDSGGVARVVSAGEVHFGSAATMAI